jgi:hypothetical protein
MEPRAAIGNEGANVAKLLAAPAVKREAEEDWGR